MQKNVSICLKVMDNEGLYHFLDLEICYKIIHILNKTPNSLSFLKMCKIKLYIPNNHVQAFSLCQF